METATTKVMFILALLFALSANAQTCSVKMAGATHAQVEINGKTISIIGWEHLDDDDVKDLEKKFDRLPSLSVKGACGRTLRRFRAIKRKYFEDVKRARMVYQTLERIHAARPLGTVGAEISPSELVQKRERLAPLVQRLAEIERRCGHTQALDDFRLVNFGPELEFERLHTDVVNEGIEDLQARKDNAEKFVIDTKENFGMDEESSSWTTRPGVWEVNQSILNQLPPPEAAIEKIVANTAGVDRAAVRQSILRDLETWKARIRLAYLRNDHIIDNALWADGNVAIPIGHYHVADLVRKFKRLCEPAPYGSPDETLR